MRHHQRDDRAQDTADQGRHRDGDHSTVLVDPSLHASTIRDPEEHQVRAA